MGVSPLAKEIEPLAILDQLKLSNVARERKLDGAAF